jgi:hypothetical protein
MLRQFFLLAFMVLSCNREYQLSEIPEDPPYPPMSINPGPFLEVEPDIEITPIRTGPYDLKPGCVSSGKFIVRNVGLGDLIVDSADAYASVPADAIVTIDPLPFPRTLNYLESFVMEIDVEATDETEDDIIAVVKSNDPDEAIAQSNLNFLASPGPKNIEEFDVDEQKRADILLVVDNSGSMGEEQTALSLNAERFINELDSLAVDYQIAVITTDRHNFVGPVIKSSDADPAMMLTSQVIVGTYGSGTEKGILMASLAMSTGGQATVSSGFIRNDSTLAIVWISDEMDNSGGVTSTWATEFWSKKSSPGEVSVWSIIGDLPYGCYTADPGYGYNELTMAMGGDWSSICSSDWGTPLAAVAQSVGVDTSFELAGQPIATTIRVWINGVESYDWVYVVADNAVSFNPGHLPIPGDHILVEYSYIEECV